MFTASPVASRSSVPVTTSPVMTPIRPCSPSSGSASRNLHRRPHRAQCVVLVQHGHAEDGHDGVADELLHGASVALDDCLHALEVAGEQALSASGSVDSPGRWTQPDRRRARLRSCAAPAESRLRRGPRHRSCRSATPRALRSRSWGKSPRTECTSRVPMTPYARKGARSASSAHLTALWPERSC